MNFWNQASQHRRLLMRILIGSTTVLVSLGAYYSYQAVRSVMLESLKSNALQELEQGREEIDRWLQSLKVHLETLSNTEVIESIDWEQAEPYLKSEILRFSDVYAIEIAHADGRSYMLGGKRDNIADRLYFQTAMQGKTTIGDPRLTESGLPTIDVSTPIRRSLDQVTTPSGIIHSLVQLNRVGYVVDGITYGDDSYAFALDSQGNVIAQPNSTIFTRDHSSGEVLLKAQNTALKTIAQKMVNQQQGIDSININGARYYVTYLPLEEANWSIGLLIPQANIESQLRALNIIGVICVGLAVTMVSVLWQVQSFEQKQLQQANETLENRVRERTSELSEALVKLKQSQIHLVQSEKMSALGGLVAGIAHEINNPVNFIHGNLAHLRQYSEDLVGFIQCFQQHYSEPIAEIEAEAEEIDLEFLQKDIFDVLSSMKIGTDRIRQIVLSLRNFSRVDEAEYKDVDIHEGIESTLLILQHRTKSQTDRPAIEIVKNYADLPTVQCYPGPLNQVFMNILANSIDALEESYFREGDDKFARQPPTIKISTHTSDDNWIAIDITDNGPGIPEEIRERIFEPFFTTKAVGKGTGMGMSISHQIVTQKHGGKLHCYSQVGQGTTFLIELPHRQAEIAAA